MSYSPRPQQGEGPGLQAWARKVNVIDLCQTTFCGLRDLRDLRPHTHSHMLFNTDPRLSLSTPRHLTLDLGPLTRDPHTTCLYSTMSSHSVTLQPHTDIC